MSGDAREAFRARLEGVLAERYHDRHPFNRRMHAGTLTPDEIRAWVRNRYYYQTRIPKKDAVILARADDPVFRREWIQRIYDHDGAREGEGGLELWLRLAEAVGLDRDEVASLAHVLPGVREACDDYVRFVEGHDLLESVAASLTERAAGEIMCARIAAFKAHYRWVDVDALGYFRKRTEQAPRDAAFGMGFVLDRAESREAQDRCVAALEHKCDILWRLLDAVEAAGARPRPAPSVLLREDAESPGRWLAVLAERAVRVNAAGHEILELCDGHRSADTIVSLLAERHPEEPSLYADVHGFLGEMRRLGVLEDTP